MLRRAVREADVVVGWFAGWHTMIPLAWSHWHATPSLLIVGGFDVAALPEIGYGDQRPGLRRYIGRWSMAAADRLLTNSDFSRREAAANTGIPAERFTVVHHGVPDPFGTLPAEPRPRKALTVGAVVESNLQRKGHEAFVRAAALLPDVEFVLVGGWSGTAIDYLRGFAAPNVTFTGRIDDAGLLDHYRTASVYVQPSRHEGFGLSVAEAMLGGCIPVVTRTAALPEVVGETGVYLPDAGPEAVAGGVEAGLSAPMDRRRAARQRVLERFPVEARRRGLLGLVEAALSESGEGRRVSPGGR